MKGAVKVKKNRRLSDSVQFRFVLSFLSVIVILIAVMNTYPLLNSRDLIFKEKERALTAQATVISSSLSELGGLTSRGVAQVMELLDVSGTDRIAVTDFRGTVLYDTGEREGYADSEAAVITEALSGNQAFYSSFSDDLFFSCAALPVYSQGALLGTVLLSETDAEQAELIVSIKDTLQIVSFSLCAVAIALTVFFSNRLTARIRAMVDAINVVSSGNYEHRLKTSGHDELTELGNEFNKLTERLESTELQRRRFVSDASHELKTPLASIRLLSDSIVMSEDMDKETVMEFVSDIGSEAERLQRMAEKLLALSRLDAEASEGTEIVDVCAVAESTLRLLRPLAEDRGVTISVETVGDCPVQASEDSVYRVVFNLAENAIKYNTERGYVHISVRRESAEVVLRVRDTGIGIPAEDRPHIFSRFYRVDKARAREAGGSGLGLSIVHDSVLAMGGKISLEDSEKGSLFVVRLKAKI